MLFLDSIVRARTVRTVRTVRTAERASSRNGGKGPVSVGHAGQPRCSFAIARSCRGHAILRSGDRVFTTYL